MENPPEKPVIEQAKTKLKLQNSPALYIEEISAIVSPANPEWGLLMPFCSHSKCPLYPKLIPRMFFRSCPYLLQGKNKMNDVCGFATTTIAAVLQSTFVTMKVYDEENNKALTNWLNKK